MGAHVTIIDDNLDRLRELDDIFLSKIATLASSAYMIHVPRTLTFALTNPTLPYALKLGEQRRYGSGFERHRFAGRRQCLRR